MGEFHDDGERRERPARLAPSARELALRAELLHLRHELRQLLDELERGARDEAAIVQSAVVTSVVMRAGMLHSREE